MAEHQVARGSVSTHAGSTGCEESTAVSLAGRAPVSSSSDFAGDVLSLNDFSMDWSSTARDGQHIWMDAENKDCACYVCGEGKNSSRGPRRRCMPCMIVVHSACMEELFQTGISCRRTFREFRRSNETEKNEHHWVRQRRAAGKCVLCSKTFNNNKLLKTREFVAISCSWCKQQYHMPCFASDPFIVSNPCHLGELRFYIVPRPWIVRVSRGRPGDRRGAMRKRAFIVRKASGELKKPLLAFINPKSGGCQGAKILSRLLWLLNPRQVFSLLVGGPEFALKLYHKLPRLRILVCGGDGTVGWVLSVIDKLGIRPTPPIAILPIGTGNDLARTLGWGHKYTDDSLQRMLHYLSGAAVVRLDRWDLLCSAGAPAPEVVNENGEENVQSQDAPLLSVFNNYFSIGADALVQLEFHESRQANPERFTSRWYNMMFYAGAGGKEMVERKSRDFSKYVGVLADGVDLTPLIRQQNLTAIVFLNICYYSGGTKPWGTGDSEAGENRLDDGKIEVIGLNSMMMAALRLGRPGVRLAQAREVTVITSRTLPVQVDGEPCRLAPSTLQIQFRNQAMMLAKVKASGNDAGHAVRSSTIASLGELVSMPATTPRHLDTDAGAVAADDDDEDNDDEGTPILATLLKEEDIVGEEPTLDVDGGGVIAIRLSDNDLDEEEFDEETLLRGGGGVGDDGEVFGELCTRPTVLYGSPSSVLLAPDKVVASTSQVTASQSAGPAAGAANARRRSSLPLLSDDGFPAGSRSCSLGAPNAAHRPLQRLQRPAAGLSQLLTEEGGKGGSAGSLSNIDMDHSLVNACKQGNVQIASRLYEMGASLTAMDDQGLMPLHHAVRHNRAAIVTYLLNNLPSDADNLGAVDSRKQQTALHKAAWYGYMDIAIALVNAGSPVLLRDYEGLTAYQRSLASANIPLQQYLCELELSKQQAQVEESRL